ncbi:MAG TPA: phosphotransferase family protein [Deltaproteobacteria bacterium]|nr:phosphotransferase family protein [Deltaproteobacteria bacterium]
MDLNDKPTAIRQGEELDTKKVGEFLRDMIPGLTGELSVQQYPSGFSNLTYLIRVGDRNMVLRRPPFGRKAKTAHDMGREFRILKALHPVFPYAPEPLVYTEDETVLGCKFYVMERISGIIIRKRLPQGLEYTQEQGKALCERLIEVLQELHSIDYVEAGLEDFGKPSGYVRRQVEGWSERYRAARTDDAPDFEDIMRWLDENTPEETMRYAIIHNDYKFDNVILSADNHLKIIGVLDWEMATIGDPLMDLGCSLGYWVHSSDSPNIRAASMMPYDIPGLFTRDEMVQCYAEKSGIQIEKFDFYHCFGAFRVAVILQQIYYRYYHGQTKDPRFKLLIFASHIIDEELKKYLAR